MCHASSTEYDQRLRSAVPNETCISCAEFFPLGKTGRKYNIFEIFIQSWFSATADREFIVFESNIVTLLFFIVEYWYSMLV